MSGKVVIRISLCCESSWFSSNVNGYKSREGSGRVDTSHRTRQVAVWERFSEHCEDCLLGLVEVFGECLE